jgi:hypothetical protein
MRELNYLRTDSARAEGVGAEEFEVDFWAILTSVLQVVLARVERRGLLEVPVEPNPEHGTCLAFCSSVENVEPDANFPLMFVEFHLLLVRLMSEFGSRPDAMTPKFPMDTKSRESFEYTVALTFEDGAKIDIELGSLMVGGSYKSRLSKIRLGCQLTGPECDHISLWVGIPREKNHGA